MKRTMLFLVALICLLAAGCAVTPEGYTKASRDCEPHGGLKYYYVFPFKETHCQDGTVIKSVVD